MTQKRDLIEELDSLIELAEAEGMNHVAAILCFIETGIALGGRVIEEMAKACYEIARRGMSRNQDPPETLQ